MTFASMWFCWLHALGKIRQAFALQLHAVGKSQRLRVQLSFKRFPLTAVDELEPERPVLLKQATTMLIKNKVLTVTDIIDNITLPQIEIEHLCRYN